MSAAPLAFVAGLMHETNTFSPVPTGLASFEEGTFVPEGGRFEEPRIDTLAYGHLCRDVLAAGWRLYAGPFAYAKPSGPVSARDHAVLRDRILDALSAAGAVDMVLLFLHGAQVAQDCDSVEADLVARIRAIVGKRVPIGVVLDLHANVAPALLRDADIVAACLEYPHTDFEERSAHVFETLRRVHDGAGAPRHVAFRLPVLALLPTTQGPMREFVAELRAFHAQPGVLSASAMHGFFLADTPHTSAMLLVTTDGPRPELLAPARRLAARFIDAVRRSPVANPGIDETLDEVLRSSETPVVIGDSGDNPGGGAAGDATFFLQALLARRVPDAAIGMLWDPGAVETAHLAGVGARLPFRLGGKVGPLSGAPVDVDAEVTCVRTDAAQSWFGQGEPRIRLGASASLRAGDLDIIVNSQRQQVFDPRCFTAHGIDIARKRIVVVKSSTHFANGFANVAGRILHCGSPGSVALSARQFRYLHLPRPVFPLDEGFMPEPVLLAPCPTGD